MWIHNTYYHNSQVMPSELSLKKETLVALAYFKRKYRDVNHTKYSWMLTIDGRHRSGKSLDAIIVADLMDKTFMKNFERRIVYSGEEMLEYFKEIAEKGIKGAALIIDEAGAACASTDWYTNIQKAILKIIQVYGFLRPILIFVSPVKEQVAGSLRKMFHTYFKIRRNDNTSNYIYPYEMEWNTFKEKIMYRKPCVRIFGRIEFINRIKISNPSPELIARYQAFEHEKKKHLVGNIKEDLNPVKVLQDEIDEEKDILKIIEEREKFCKQRKDGFWKVNPQKVRYLLDKSRKITTEYAKMLCTLAEEKMNEVVDVKEDT